MATSTRNAPDDQGWLEAFRDIENFAGEPERVTGFEQTAGPTQEGMTGLAQQQGAGASNAGECQEPNLVLCKYVVPERLTNKTGFRPVLPSVQVRDRS